MTDQTPPDDSAKLNGRERLCPACGLVPLPERPPAPLSIGAVACDDCATRLPPSLIQALYDHWDFTIQIRTGQRVHYNHAEGHGDFVTLHAIDGSDGVFLAERCRSADCGAAHPPRRGLDVAVDDITLAWAWGH